MTTVCGCGHEKAVHNHGTDGCWAEGCGCCEFIPDVKAWKEAKARWDWEDAHDAESEAEIFAYEQAQREGDNDSSSGSTDLGNRGGTTFNY